jgi:hypothetical protein
MASWSQVEEAAPDLAKTARALFDAYKHKTLATLRRDGSPRISGIELRFDGGDAWLGMMPGSLKARDLQRDPRMALHSASTDPPEDDPAAWPGDAKLGGLAIEVTDPETLARFSEDSPPEGMHLFRIDLTELAVTRVGTPADHLVIEVWRPGSGVRRLRRT